MARRSSASMHPPQDPGVSQTRASPTLNSIASVSAPRPSSDKSTLSQPSPSDRNTAADGVESNRPKSYSLSSNGHTLASSSRTANEENRAAQRVVNTLPPWVRSYVEPEDEDEEDVTKRLLASPSSAQVAQHNHSPAPKHKFEPGRLHDAARESTPVTISSSIHESGSRWKAFAHISAPLPPPSADTEKVDETWMEQNMPDLEAPWCPGLKQEEEIQGLRMLFNDSSRKRWLARSERAVLRNPMIPLIFRSINWIFSLIALALGASIFSISRSNDVGQRPSTMMAVIFDTIALIYIIYITYDEYTGKPLGLRSPRAKMRLILLDLVFICFNSANLSLAFDALTDVRWSCRDGPDVLNESTGLGSRNGRICDRQQALSGVLLISLVAWLLNFVISIFRLVERVTRD